MMLLRFKLILSVLLLFSVNALAQFELGTEDSTDDVEIFDKDKEEKESKGDDDNNYFDDGTYRNMVKFNITHITNGEFLFSYERTFKDNFAAEIALGPTYYSYLIHAFAFDNYYIPPKGDIEGQAVSSTGRSGYSYRLGARYYFDDYPESWFIGLEARKKRFNHTLDLEDYASIPGTVDLKQRYTEYYLLGGYHMDFYDPIYIEYNFGVGVRKRNLEYIDYDYDASGNRYYLLFNEKTSYPFVTAACKIGVTF